MTFEYKNIQYRAIWLSPTRLSVVCLEPSQDDDGIDYTDWPSNRQISEEVGVGVRFACPGDDPDYPESIYDMEKW